jgi:hypothetical protein
MPLLSSSQDLIGDTSTRELLTPTREQFKDMVHLDFEVLDLQHVPRANNAVADELSTKGSTWAPVPDGVFERRLL